jgi:hypothetical protein
MEYIVKNAGDLKTFSSVEQLMEDLNNVKITNTLRIKWFYQRVKRSIRNAIRTPKWWYQRAKRGYSDRDVWNADIYLAGVFAGVLDWYIHQGHGVSMAYSDPSDPHCEDVDAMVIRRNADYLKHIEVFNRYRNNGIAFDEEDAKEFGGVLDKDIRSSVQWLSEHFTELWD